METVIGKNQKGFTLAELIIAMAGSLLVLAAVGSVFRMQTHTVKAQEYKMEAQEYARAALDMMTREIRNAGFFSSGTTCTAVPILTATTTTFQFVYDVNSDCLFTGTMAAVGADENVTYAYNGTDITRSVNGGAAQSLTAGNVINPTSFTYFDAAGLPTTVPANIKRVSISLTVQSRSTDAPFGGGQLITMTSNVDLRNRCVTSACAQM